MKTNEEWLWALRTDGAEQEDALTDLRQRLIHGMHAYLSENRGYGSIRGPEEARQIVEDCAQECLLIIKRKIDTFRGESRFTTWATTIAIRKLLSELRRRHARISRSKIRAFASSAPAARLSDFLVLGYDSVFHYL